MSESFKSGAEKLPQRPSPEQVYKKLPAAKARIFSSEAGTTINECFAFPPVNISVIPEFFEGEEVMSEEEKGLFKLSKESVSGDFEVTCCARDMGDMNRIDKMIHELDIENPWQPAKLEHLLFFRMTNPDLLPKGPVVAFGTEQRQHMPRLDEGKLGKHFRHGGFNSNVYFLVVRQLNL